MGLSSLRIPTNEDKKMIKLRQHYVTNGAIKARVSYSMDNRIDGRKCVTIHDKDWCRALGKIFKEGYKNETDSMTDYFDQGSVSLFEGNKYYAEARKIAELIAAKRQAKWGK